jgi:uncharacterized membrane protein YkvA (DUF1232 family)
MNDAERTERRTAARGIVKRAMRLPLAHKLRFATRLAVDARVPLPARMALFALLVYLAMPLDIIPDFIPVIGYLDDLLVAGIAVWWFLRTCPPAIALEHLDVLERTPLGRTGPALPWILGAPGAAVGVALVVVLYKRRGLGSR